MLQIHHDKHHATCKLSALSYSCQNFSLFFVSTWTAVSRQSARKSQVPHMPCSMF